MAYMHMWVEKTHFLIKLCLKYSIHRLHIFTTAGLYWVYTKIKLDNINLFYNIKDYNVSAI